MKLANTVLQFKGQQKTWAHRIIQGITITHPTHVKSEAAVGSPTIFDLMLYLFIEDS